MLTPPDQTILAQLSTPQPQCGRRCQDPSLPRFLSPASRICSLLCSCSSTHSRIYTSFSQVSSYHVRLNPSQHTGSGIDPSGLSVEHSQPLPASRQEHTIERRCDHGQCHRGHVSQWIMLRLPCPPRACKPQRAGKHMPPKLDEGTVATPHGDEVEVLRLLT